MVTNRNILRRFRSNTNNKQVFIFIFMQNLQHSNFRKQKRNFISTNWKLENGDRPDWNWTGVSGSMDRRLELQLKGSMKIDYWNVGSQVFLRVRYLFERRTNLFNIFLVHVKNQEAFIFRFQVGQETQMENRSTGIL